MVEESAAKGIEHLPELSEKDALDILYWSFQYSQGLPTIQELIYNYVRRDYNLPASVVARYRAAPSDVTDEHTGKPRFYDDFDMSAKELVRYENFLAGDHTRNTGGQVPTHREQAIREQIGEVIGELINPKKYQRYTKQRIREELVLRMLEQDYLNVVRRGRKDSHILGYLMGTKPLPGPSALTGLVQSLRETLFYIQEAPYNMEVTIEASRGLDKVRMPVSQVLGELRRALGVPEA